VPTVEDLRAGLLHAMRGRIRARSGDAFQQNERRVVEFLDRYVEPALKRSSGVYWCRFFRGPLRENRGEAEALVGEGRRLANDAALADSLDGGDTLFPRFRPFVTFVTERERPGPALRPADAGRAVFSLLERFSLFTCEEEATDDDAPLD